MDEPLHEKLQDLRREARACRVQALALHAEAQELLKRRARIMTELIGLREELHMKGYRLRRRHGR